MERYGFTDDYCFEPSDPVDPPEFSRVMESEHEEIIETKEEDGETVRLLMLTWNVAEKKPPISLEDALSLTRLPLPLIYGIGLQEVGAKDVNDWVDSFTNCLASYDFVRVKMRQLIGMLTMAFVQRALLPACTSIESEVTKTGFGGWWGNKGGVSIRMDVLGINLIIVNCHLAAHQDTVAERILDFDTILDTQKFKDNDVENILDHDYVFWMGDLNFRVDHMTRVEIDKAIQEKDFEKLLQNDQLLKCQEAGLVFENFKEMDIAFPPTYKFDIGTDMYDSSQKKRLPAYCDRILWHTYDVSYKNCRLKVKPLEYKSHPRYRISDHKPVSAIFTFTVFQRPPPRSIVFDYQPTWSRNQDCVVRYYANKHTKTSSSDWIGLYKAGFVHFEEYISYVYGTEGAEKKKSRVEGVLVVFRPREQNIQPGEYCLLYLTKKFSPLGISNCFKIL